MNMKDKVMEILKLNNGIIFASQAKRVGIDNKVLQRLNTAGEIERVEVGLYIDPDIIEDEYVLAQYRCREGIYSHETALFFHDLSDRTPFQLTMTIPSGYNTRLLKNKNQYKFFYIAKKLHSVGKITVNSPYGNKINVYSKERTICDCINKKDQLDRDIVLSAIKRYIKGKEKNYSKLLECAELFKISGIVRNYLEVLV